LQTKIFKKVRDNIDCKALQRDLDNVVMWAQKWQMDVNVKKCKVMHVGSRLLAVSTTWEETLEMDLVVCILAETKCFQQCRYAVNKANKVVDMIRRTIICKDPKIMLKLYKTLVNPHVEYVLAHGAHIIRRIRIGVSRKRSTKIYVNEREVIWREITKVEILDIGRNKKQDLIEVFKICKGFSKMRPNELLHFNDRGKGTRGHSLKLVKVRCTRDSRRHFY